MSAPFDPAQHRRHENRWFEDFRVGERFVLPSRTMTEAGRSTASGSAQRAGRGKRAAP